MPCVGPGGCLIGPVLFLTGWFKRRLNLGLGSFGLFCAYVSSFLVWLFRFLCVVDCNSVPFVSISQLID